MIKIIFILFLCHLPFFLHAQKEGYIWTFGDSAAIDFNGTFPVPFQGTNVYSLECSSTICDQNGNLLFYAGANDDSTGNPEVIVYNKYNKIINNGTGIHGHWSSTQGCLLIPETGDSNKIYLFTHRLLTGSNLDFRYFYSVIDKSANSDSGAVILKNIPLPGIAINMSEHMLAIRHGNGKDWWLILHKGNGNEFYKYLIDSSGINGPFIQSIGSTFPNFSSIGQLTISINGSKLIIITHSGIIDLYDFNRCSGILSNWIPIGFVQNLPNTKYGCSLSANSKVLYVSDVDSGLFQYNLLAPNIAASRQLIWAKPNNGSEFGQLKLAPDGKIYAANCKPGNHSPGIFNLENMNLSVINLPDSLSLACDFQPYSFSLGGRRSFYGLPNIPDYNLGAVEPACDDTVAVNEASVLYKQPVVYPNPALDVIYFNLGINKITEVNIFDVVGKLVKQEIFNAKNEIDVSELNPGIYFVKVKSGEQELISKFVKQ